MHFAGTLVALGLVLTGNIWGASAALYPTQPTASTIFYSGKQAALTWKDSRRRPALEEMGDVRIELICKEDFVAVLEKGVSPIARAYSVQIPGGLAERSDYMIRFRSQYPPLSVYTAYFTIKADSNLPAKVDLANATISALQSQASPTATSPPVGTIRPSPAEPSSTRVEATSSRFRKNAGMRLDPSTSGFNMVTFLLPSILGIFMAL